MNKGLSVPEDAEIVEIELVGNYCLDLNSLDEQQLAMIKREIFSIMAEQTRACITEVKKS